MDKFIYKAKNVEGKTITGRVEAQDEKGAVELVRQRKMVVIELKPYKERGEIPIISKFFSGIKYDQVVNFTRQLSTMITAGLSVTEALSILESQSEKALSLVIAQVLRDVEGGMALGASLEKHPKVFSKVYVALVRVGEAAGVLDRVLRRLAINLEKEREFRGKVKGALIYPAIVMIGMGVVAIVMMVFVIPKLTNMYKDFGANLPMATLVLMTISGFVVRWWWLFLILTAASVLAFRAWLKTPIGRMQFDLWLFKIPIIGPLRTQVILTDFTRTMGLLIGTGVSVLEGLEIVRMTLDSAVYEQGVGEAAKAVEKGFPLGMTLAQDVHFPPVVSQMVSVGEETGKLDEVLKKLARYFETESAEKIKSLTTAIEPLIMILLGVGVGFLVVAVILPIYNLTSQF